VRWHSPAANDRAARIIMMTCAVRATAGQIKVPRREVLPKPGRFLNTIGSSGGCVASVCGSTSKDTSIILVRAVGSRAQAGGTVCV